MANRKFTTTLLILSALTLQGCNGEMDNVKSLKLIATDLNGSEINSTVGEHMESLSSCESYSWEERDEYVVFSCFNSSQAVLDKITGILSETPLGRIEFSEKQVASYKASIEEAVGELAATKSQNHKTVLVNKLELYRGIVKSNKEDLQRELKYLDALKPVKLQFDYKLSPSDSGEAYAHQLKNPELIVSFNDRNLVLPSSTKNNSFVTGVSFVDALDLGKYHDNKRSR
ncbi:hypothetical protein [Enterovibrio norvegicus]|uniref:hypothetical protein n=1 Tax=Enterovibrio norvegicus TaxID=188144 RepID=UPI000C84EDC1|nr:hypothetical protein [Enterovibrio norvegicus]PMH64507.1 hypothetical protein BCU62_15750 [Enterovibrio norvegicus]